MTTKQMQDAPQGAIFVWCNSHLEHPLMIARRINRPDLEIVSPHWLNDYRYVGRALTGLVIDHALPTMNKSRPDEERLAHHIERAKAYIRVPPNGL